MIENKRVLAIVPARGGSKSVPLKNIRPVAGVPLVALVARVIQQVPYIDRAVVSTDHPEIMRVAKEAGLDAPFTRPEELSGDRIGDWQVLSHALAEVEKLDGVEYDLILMLQPTSPMRKPIHVIECIEKTVRESWDTVWSISPIDLKYHPLKSMTVAEDGAMEYYDPRGAKIVARQELTPLYYRNGACYVFTRDCLVNQKDIYGKRSAPYVIEEQLVDIDSLEDIERASRLLEAETLAAKG